MIFGFSSLIPFLKISISNLNWSLRHSFGKTLQLVYVGHLLILWRVMNVSPSAGCVEFGPDVTSSDRSTKVMLNSQDKVGHHQRWLQINPTWCSRSTLIQVFNQIRNEHFSNVFGYLSQKARNLQTAYDVRIWSVIVAEVINSCDA